MLTHNQDLEWIQAVGFRFLHELSLEFSIVIQTASKESSQNSLSCLSAIISTTSTRILANHFQQQQEAANTSQAIRVWGCSSSHFSNCCTLLVPLHRQFLWCLPCWGGGGLLGAQHCSASYSCMFAGFGSAVRRVNMSQATLQDQETRSGVGCVSHGVFLMSCDLHREVL